MSSFFDTSNERTNFLFKLVLNFLFNLFFFPGKKVEQIDVETFFFWWYNQQMTLIHTVYAETSS